MKDRIPIGIDFGQALEDNFGMLTIAPTPKAQALWEQWQKNPTMYTLAPGYTENKETGVQDLVELSIIPKVSEKK